MNKFVLEELTIKGCVLASRSLSGLPAGCKMLSFGVRREKASIIDVFNKEFFSTLETLELEFEESLETNPVLHLRKVVMAGLFNAGCLKTLAVRIWRQRSLEPKEIGGWWVKAYGRTVPNITIYHMGQAESGKTLVQEWKPKWNAYSERYE